MLHFDFTYRAVGGIWVDAPLPGDTQNRQRVELSYVLGSVLGSTGCVLASVIGSTETWDNVKDTFEMAFAKTKRAPEVIWIDDVPRWGAKLLALVIVHFGQDNCRIGQDWRHFKELLLANMDKQHCQYNDVRRDVEGLLRRLRHDSMEGTFQMAQH